ncbi:hypothetical protein HDK64DRAFT_267351 [Phyllosticta capitalensis]
MINSHTPKIYLLLLLLPPLVCCCCCCCYFLISSKFSFFSIVGVLTFCPSTRAFCFPVMMGRVVFDYI